MNKQLNEITQIKSSRAAALRYWISLCRWPPLEGVPNLLSTFGRAAESNGVPAVNFHIDDADAHRKIAAYLRCLPPSKNPHMVLDADIAAAMAETIDPDTETGDSE